MIQKKITRTITLSLIIVWSFTAFYTPAIIAAVQQPPMMMGDQMLTPEDLQAMERAVEEERAKMSPEERAAFDNEVEQLTKELEAMKPEELEAFMNQVLFGQPEQAPQEAPVVVTPPAPAPVQKVEPAKPQKPRKKQDEALARIDGIINHTTSFLNKIARYIDFTGKLKKWSEQGKINGWKPTFTWDAIKKQIEDLINKLTTIKDKDPKTGDYKYLNDLIEDESLYNNLGKLNDSLAKLEPDIEIDDFGIEPVSRQVRYVIRKVLAEYIESLTELNIASDLDKLIAKYEPTAKKHREEQEALTKKSLEESKLKQQRRVTPAVVGGKGDRGDSYSGGYGAGTNPYDYYPYSGGYSPSSYGSYGNDTDGYQPPTPPSASSGSRGGGASGGSSTSDKEKDGKKEREEKEESRKYSESKPKERSKTDKLIDKFEEDLEDAIDKLKNEDVPLSIISDPASTNDQDKKILNAIENANLSIEFNVLRTLEKLKKASLSKEQRNKIQSTYTKQQKSLDQIVKSIDEIDETKATISTTRKELFDIDDKAPKVKAKKTEGIEELEEGAPAELKRRTVQSPYRLKENIANIKKAYDALFPKTK